MAARSQAQSGPRRRATLWPYLFILGLALVVYVIVGPRQYVNALTVGAIYALIALGYTMVYGIIELINFAHGDVFMVGAFVAMFTLINILGQTGPSSDLVQVGVLLVGTFLLTMVVMGAVGVIIERLAYRPLRNAPRLAPLITAIGVSYILQNIIQIIYGPSPVNVPQVISPLARLEVGTVPAWDRATNSFIDVPLSIGWINIFIIATAVVLMVALSLFVNRTRLGRAMRATAQDRQAAQLMGVDINRTIAATFFIGSALAGAAGVIYGQYYGNINFGIGFLAGLKAFTAAVLGGIGNTTGAALGGFVIGFVEIGAAALGYNIWGPPMVFVVLILVLVFRPSGILGQHVGDRA